MTSNIFTDGTTLEQMSPEAHQKILSAARWHARHTLESYEYALERADLAARDAAELLHEATQTGRQTMWLQVVRYAVELHACALVAQARR